MPDLLTPTVKSRKAALIVNNNSRRGKEWFSEVKKRLEEAGVEFVLVLATGNAGRLITEVKKQIELETPLVIVGGGDGTFNSVVRFFAHRRTVLGVLPLGTGNAFARDLGIPAEVEAACDAILNGKTSSGLLDLGNQGDPKSSTL